MTAQLLHALVTDTIPQSPVHLAVSRRELAELFRELGFGVGAEIGVFCGVNARTLCAANPHLHLYAVDPWAVSPQYYEQKNHAAVMEAAYQEAQVRLSPYKVTFLRMDSQSAAQRVPDGSLDFVYIDAAHHYEAVKRDIELWVPKVRKGGVVSGHDFLTKLKRHIDVERAVRDYTAKHQIEPWFVLAPGKGDAHPSWMWVKQ